MTRPDATLLHRLVRFGRALRGAGLPVGPESTALAAEAWAAVGVERREDWRAAARAVYVGRRAHLAAFDELFDRFWDGEAEPPGDAPPLLPPGPQARAVRLAPAPPGEGDGEGEAPEVLQQRWTWSAAERLRRRDFASLSDAEREAVGRLLSHLELDLAPRRSRRLVPARRGRTLDLRRTLRAALGAGGEPLALARRRRKVRPRPLVLLVDVSASMEVYARLLLQFVYAVLHAGERVEVFAFGTRLTRLTRELGHRHVDRALDRAAARLLDWGGGTRIGAALRTFNARWARRVLGRGAVVAVFSDGWDRGEPAELEREVARLARSAHRLLWLNPVAGTPGFEPLTRALVTALPHVDEHLPVHSLESLEQLARRLGRLRRRPVAARR